MHPSLELPADGEPASLRAVLEAMPTALVLVEVGTGRVLFANRSARLRSFAFDEELPDGVAAVDGEGRTLARAQLPRARAARGEQLDDEVVTFRTRGGAATFLVHSETVPASERAVAVLTLEDVTSLYAAVGARDEFMALAAHELKSPIASVQLVLERLARLATRVAEVKTTELAERLEPALRQVTRLTKLVQMLLDVSAIRHGRFAVARQSADVRAIVRDTALGLSDLAARAGSQLALHLPGEPVVAAVDPSRLEQAVTNLVANAIKYGDGKPIEVTLARAEATVTIVVRDHGIGIAAADRERIFAPFERAATRHAEQSLGLGLYVAREVVRAHGGHIELESEPGEGATFQLHLPADAVEER